LKPWWPFKKLLLKKQTIKTLYRGTIAKVAGDKGISEMKSKQQSPCSNCMHQPVTSCLCGA